MPYLNSRLHALVAMSLLLLTAPALLAQDESSVVSTGIRGDVDGDGRVTAADAEAVRAYLVRGTVPAGREIMPAGDANADGRITAADAALISRFAAGVDVTRFPVGRRLDDTGGKTDGSRSLLTLFDCTSTLSGAVSCQPVSGSDAAMLNIIVGTPYIEMASTGASVSNGNPANPDTVTYTWKMTNRMSQSIGTTDGTTPDPAGSRLFFTQGPTATSAVPGNTRPLKNLGVTPVAPRSSFTSAQGTTWTNPYYFQFDGVIAKDSSVSRQVSFVYDPRVLSFSFQLLVATPVPFDQGWLTLAPADSIIAPDSTVALQGTEFNHRSENLGSGGITWSSSDPAVATVSSTGVVTGVGEGTALIRAVSAANAVRRDSMTIVVDRFPEVSGTTPADGAVNISPSTTITVTFTEPVAVSTSSFELRCPSGGSLLSYTISGDSTSAITLTPAADLPAGTACEVTVKGNQVQDVDTNDGPNFMPGQHVFDFEIGIQAVNDAFGTTTTGNVRINSDGTSFTVLTNDKAGPSPTFSFVGWSGTEGKTLHGGDVSMDVDGTFTYNPPAGFEGTDSLEYTIQSGSSTASAKVSLPVSGMIWFVNNGGAACTSVASGCGRLTNPYSTLAAFNAENNGSGTNPAAGDAVFLYESATPYTGPVALLAQQKLIGQDAGASLSAITGITPAAGSDALPSMNTGGNTVTINGGTGGVALANIGASSGANNTVRGLSIATSGGAGLSGTSFGSPVIEEVSISVTGGPSLSLSGGTVNSTFATASSASSSTQGISLTNVAGTLTFGSGTSLTNSTGTTFFVSGGAPAITYSGGMTKNGSTAGRLVEINGVTGGTITFDTGTLSATSSNALSTGIQLSNAAGTVNFNGTVDLNNPAGGDAGIDIVSGSTGTFTFGANTLVQNPAGIAFNVNGSSPNVTFNGSLIRTSNNALLVDITNNTLAAGRSIVFDPAAGTDSLYATVGDGIQLSNVDGPVDFNGRVRLAGGNAGVDIINGSSGNIDFDAATIANPTGEALRISNGSGGDQPADVSFAGAITTNAGRPVLIEDVSSGTVAVSASINTTAGLGVLVQNNTGGTFTFSNATQSLATGANAAVTLSSNTGATVNFTGGALAISTLAGAGFSATGGGTVNVEGSANTVSSTTGTPVTISSTTIGSNGVRFRSVSANGAANGIFLSGTGNSGGEFLVTGTGTAGSGGIIANSTGGDGATAGNGVYLANANNVRLRRMQLNDHSNHAVFGSAISNVTLDTMVISGTNGNSLSGTFNEGSIHFETLSGSVIIRQSTITGGFLDNIYVANTSGAPVLNRLQLINNTIGGTINQDGVRLNATVGTFNVTATGNNFTYWEGDAFDMLAQGTSTGDLIFQNNTVHNGNVSPVSGSTNVAVGGGNFTYNISNNSFRGAAGAAVAVDESGSLVGNVSGTIDNNQIGASGVTNSGSSQGSGIFVQQAGAGTSTTRVSNNTIRQINGTQAILIQASDASAGGGNGTLNATVIGNNIQEEGSLAATRTAMNFNIGTVAGDAHTVCLQIGGSGAEENSITNFDSNRYRVQHRFNTTVRMPGYAGGAYDVAAVGSYLTPRNDIGGQALTNNSTSSGTGGGFQNTAGGASCPQP